MQQAVLHLKKKFGNNAVLKGMDLEAPATSAVRNELIGGHKAEQRNFNDEYKKRLHTQL